MAYQTLEQLQQSIGQRCENVSKSKFIQKTKQPFPCIKIKKIFDLSCES